MHQSLPLHLPQEPCTKACPSLCRRSYAPEPAPPSAATSATRLGWDLYRVQCSTVLVPDHVRLGGDGGSEYVATVVGRLTMQAAKGSTLRKDSKPAEAQPVPRLDPVSEHQCVGAYGSWCQIELRQDDHAPFTQGSPPAQVCSYVCGFAGAFMPHRSSPQARSSTR